MDDFLNSLVTGRLYPIACLENLEGSLQHRRPRTLLSHCKYSKLNRDIFITLVLFSLKCMNV